MAQWRYIAQNILTSEFLHWDLPLKRDDMSWELSGPGSMRSTIDPQYRYLIPFEPWQTAIYAEVNDQIRWGGILINRGSTGSALSLDCAGFSAYPSGIPYTGPWQKRINYSAMAQFSGLWSHLQSQPDGNIGMNILARGTSPKIGTVYEPYELKPEEAVDVGQELAELAQEAPFEYVETHQWQGDDILHLLTLDSPRVGRKRDDLAFVQGANIVSVVPIVRSGESFANTVYGIGQGEGHYTVKTEVAQRDGRLRRPTTYTDKMATTVSRLNVGARRQFTGRQLVPDIDSIDVKQHPNAPIFSWSVGDDILVETTLPWEGDLAIWCRIIGWTLTSETTATLQLARSDSFIYGGS